MEGVRVAGGEETTPREAGEGEAVSRAMSRRLGEKEEEEVVVVVAVAGRRRRASGDEETTVSRRDCSGVGSSGGASMADIQAEQTGDSTSP
jgi:hypothetical protein